MFRLLPILLLVAALAGCGDQPSPAGEGSTSAPTSTTSAVPEASFTATSAAAADATATVLPVGASTGTLRHRGIDRTYRLYVPRAVAAREPAPLVVGLHGGLGSGQQFATTTKFEDLAEDEGFIAVFPDGVERTWNGGRCCGQAVRQGIDDVGFLAALIEKLAAELPVDRERVFMTGHSNGAIMAWRFGCERADLVAGIAPVAGSLEIPNCPATRGVHLLAIHGDADRTHPLEGGRGERSIAGVDFTSVAASIRTWTETMGCDATSAQAPSQGAVTTDRWSNCRDDAETILTVIQGADHPWPGGIVLVPELQGEPSQAMNATEVVWAFFAQVGAD